MTHEEMFQAALRRPCNYLSLSAREQWAIDKDLGILDWEGPRTEEEYKQLAKHLRMKRL
jgi:hypothetical protein